MPDGPGDMRVDAPGPLRGGEPRVVEMGLAVDDRARRPHSWRTGAVVGLLVAVVTAGYLSSGRATPAADAAVNSRGTTVAGAALAATGNICNRQSGQHLQLGAELANGSNTVTTVHTVIPVLPMGGLYVNSWQWGTCGQAEPPGDGDGAALPAGTSVWFTVTFNVLDACPAQVPVEFDVDYTAGDRPATLRVAEFPDLGNVPYSGCVGKS